MNTSRMIVLVAGWCLGLAAPSVWSAQPVVAPSAPAQQATQVDRSAAARAIIKKVFDEQNLVGLSVVIADDGKPVFEHHAGFADREANVPASAETMYRWASISKPVTATAAMQLVEAGKLDLDTDVRVLVPEFPQKPWPITARQLLCHQGGIVHYDNGPVITEPGPSLAESLHPYEDVIVALSKFRKSKLVNEPGTKYAYTTHGYMLLAAVVERAAGGVDAKQASVVKFWPLVKEKIATPAGMTTFQPDYQWVKIDHRAVGYRKPKAKSTEEGKGDEMVRSTDTDVSWKLGGGGFISTVGDLSRYSVALMDGKLVKPETFARMCTAQKLRNGNATTYGLGLTVGSLAGKPTASHSGSQEKTATYLLMIPGEQLSVSVMCNTEGSSLDKLAKSLAAEWMGVAVEKPAAEKK